MEGDRQPTHEMVPKELALALLGARADSPGGAPQLLVGRAPDWIPAGIIPSDPGASVVGSLASADRPDDDVRARRATIVVRMTGTAAETIASYNATLESAGWKAPFHPGRRAGFLTSDAFMLNVFCRDDRSLMARTCTRPEGGCHLVVTFGEHERNGVCSERARDHLAARMFREDLIELPPLVAPTGMISQGGGNSSHGSSQDSSTRPCRSARPGSACCALRLTARGGRMGRRATGKRGAVG
jgi:hypothetical protein